MNRRLAGLLAAVLLLPFATACGSTSATPSSSNYDSSSTNTTGQTAAAGGSSYYSPSSSNTTSSTSATNSTSNSTGSANNSASNTSPPATPSAPPKSNVPWLSFDKSKRTVSLRITAAQTNNNGGFNFNGYSSGAMTVIVPVNWRVQITFNNASSSVPHSLEIVAYADRDAAGGFTPAFVGAATPAPGVGITAGQTQTVSFTADKIGSYAFVCGVPGHEPEGMWDNFVVSQDAASPSAVIGAGQASGSSNASGGSDSGGGW